MVLIVILAFGLLYLANETNFGSQNTKDVIPVDPPVVPVDFLIVDSPATIGEGFGKAVAGGAYSMSGKYITGWNISKHWPIASITKLVTAVVAMQNIGPNTEVVIGQEAVDAIGDSGGFVAGEHFQVNDLVKAMMMVSSNDAAVALASHYGEVQFVAKMNNLAEQLGMEDTYFVDPIGLSVENKSTIQDLLKLIAYIWENERVILNMSRQSTDIIVDTMVGRVRQLISINAFANRSDFLGGKTGMLPVSDGNLISVFSVPGVSEPVVITIFGSKDRFGETANILSEL